MKYITIFFDFEGKWGMPYKNKYDLVKTTHRLLEVLNKYEVKAVFFVVGKIIEENPDLIKEIAEYGHEIALHGYSHEHLNKLTKKELIVFSNNLSRIELSLEKLVGKRPVGFRSPYLMAPKFYTPELYKILDEHGYQWVSNRELRYPEELFRPDRLRLPFLWGKNNWFINILFILLNIRLFITETTHNKSGLSRVKTNLLWLNRGTEPFRRGNLIELPLYSPLDCDLLGLPTLDTATSNDWSRYTTTCLVGGVKRKGIYYILNFHDWIIGSSNRVLILENILKLLKSGKNNKFMTTTNLIRLINKKFIMYTKI